jgi:hypothetical protein
LIDGERAISDITSKIVEEFDVEPDVAEKDALEFFREIQEFVQFRRP